MGTFGLRRQLLTGAHEVEDSHCVQGSRVSSRFGSSHITPTNSSQYLSPQAEHGYYDHRLSSGTSRFTLSAYLSPRKKKTSETCSLPSSPRSPGSSTWTTPFSSSDTLSLPDTYRRSPSIGASLSTIVFAAGSAASPTLSASIVTEAQLYASRHRQHAGSSASTYANQADFPASSARSPELGHSRTSIFLPVISRPNSPLSGPVLTRDGPRIRTCSTGSADSGRSGRSACSARSNLSSRSTRSVLIGPPVNSSSEPDATVPGLPPVLSWLQNVRPELWIDQEGFRLVRPVFKLSGYATPSHTDGGDSDLVNSLTNGSAEFRLAETQSFVFHHGTLDPPPVLRKLTLADDESRDYISRQASLAVKADGVYSVSGIESFESNTSNTLYQTNLASHHRPLKLTWRFEYRVEDATAKMRAGEKILIPLSFSCSPGLLHPTHGKKIKIIQVVKKGLAPKLASEKLDMPPADVRVRVQTEPPSEIPHIRHALHDEDRFGIVHAGLDLASRHRRVQSTSAQPLVLKAKEDGAEGNRSGSKKTKSASLVVDWSSSRTEAHLERQFVVGDPLMSFLAANSCNDTGRTDAHQISRHILPPTQLSDMLDKRPNLCVLSDSSNYTVGYDSYRAKRHSSGYADTQ
ncbi:uncharacterized protein PHACADRAFT_168831 [Phanerochaete carnosa HHB-10118-sp]|uniref:Uncharacterized protein n=1 Tax=Phanerochaete carnosa (strain HHB-10118-sp) TaxID=650164 RepID=K5WPL0_PHACS|nr:uncharacterized protein PHACADRAFT_168831 [Phanerochaete carnosa HHB-10118-sp]EKM61385.1 hypothetical protein PHACADRAFT_168831 [Phanerochaete carnosa HHB-10118-sp]